MARFDGVQRFLPSGNAASSSQANARPAVSRANQLGIGLGSKSSGIGLGKHSMGLGKGKALKRHSKVQRDTIRGITKGDIRRLARRGGIKRISGTVYDAVRDELRDHLKFLLRDIITIVEHSGRKTVAVTDVIWALNRLGRPLYGFTPHFDGRHRS